MKHGSVLTFKFNVSAICCKSNAGRGFYRNKTDMLGEGICYKSIVVREGDRIHPPAEPAGAGAYFAGWRDINDYMADFSCPVEQKLTYYADWE